MNEAENKKAAYDFYGKMPFRKAFPLGLQHVLAMFCLLYTSDAADD